MSDSWTLLNTLEVVRLLVDIALLIVASTLLYKNWGLPKFVRQLADEAKQDRKFASEDRKINSILLRTIKGWTAVSESKDQEKLEKIQQVANLAAQSTADITKAINEAVGTVNEAVGSVPKQTADKIVEQLGHT